MSSNASPSPNSQASYNRPSHLIVRRRNGLREFTDERGRKWTAWDVFPTLAERRERDAGPPPGVRERRRFVEPRARISARMARGWLAFEAADGERRRLAPIPK